MNLDTTARREGDVVVVLAAPGVALAEFKLLSGRQAVDRLTCDASSGEGVAGVVELGAPEAGLDGASILGETEWMQVDPTAKAVLKFNPDREPVLPGHKAERVERKAFPDRSVRGIGEPTS